jgi:hypothetical protein
MAGATALSVSAGVIVVALAYGLFALVKPYVGAAGASGVVAAAAAVLIGLIGLILANLAKPPKPPKRKPDEPESVVDRIVDFVRTRPVTAVGAALVAGLLAVRNPGYLGLALRTFVEGRDPPKKPRR